MSMNLRISVFVTFCKILNLKKYKRREVKRETQYQCLKKTEFLDELSSEYVIRNQTLVILKLLFTVY